MKSAAWPEYSFTEWLRPPEGWRTERAILSTYSAELFTVLTALVALAGGNRDERSKLDAVEVIKAMDGLKGRVRVLAQAGRVTAANKAPAALKLMDNFVKTIEQDETKASWHPKAALVCHQNRYHPNERQWGFWLGSWNLTNALNWDAGVGLVSSPDGKGTHIEGLAEAAAVLADYAALPELDGAQLRRDLRRLTWDGPAGCEVRRIFFHGPGLHAGFPNFQDARCVRVISPFVDTEALRAVAGLARPDGSIAVLSTDPELARIEEEDGTLLRRLNPRTLPIPELPGEGANDLDEEEVSAPVADAEEPPPLGLHAKLFYAEKGTDRRLWIGSANATARGWKGRNFELVAEMSIGRDAADSLKNFVEGGDVFQFGRARPPQDEAELSLERARKALSGSWPLRQVIGEPAWEILASAPPPLKDPAIELSVAPLGGSWTAWPSGAERLLLPGMAGRSRSDFLRLRISCEERMCMWVQVAPCEPPPDEARDQVLIGECLDAKIFLEWIRSQLLGEPARGVGGDLDAQSGTENVGGRDAGAELPEVPTVEEVLGSWARDPAAFVETDKNVTRYLAEVERRAAERNAADDLELLQAFRQCWSRLASELR